MEKLVAYARPQWYEGESVYPPASIDIEDKLWGFYGFEVLEDENQMEFDEGEESFNLALIHPYTKEVFYAYSIDFEFLTVRF